MKPLQNLEFISSSNSLDKDRRQTANIMNSN
jgi:hypothetical protein